MELKYYAIISCSMGEDFIEIEGNSLEEMMDKASEWVDKKVEECDMWDCADLVRCPAEVDDDGEIVPNTSEYVEWYPIWQRDYGETDDDF